MVCNARKKGTKTGRENTIAVAIPAAGIPMSHMESGKGDIIKTDGIDEELPFN